MRHEDAERELELVEEHGFEVEVLRQLNVVRETGAVNMHNAGGVHEVARECGFEALDEFLDRISKPGGRYHPDAYMKYLREMGDRYA